MMEDNLFIVTVPSKYAGGWPYFPMDNVTDWLEENVGKREFSWCHIGGLELGFFDAEDATAFRLRFSV